MRYFTFIIMMLVLLSCKMRQELWITYNVQNLFDSVIDGTEYREFQAADRWTNHHYQQKLINTASVIDMISHQSSTKIALLALQEIENDRVLSDLIAHTKNLTSFHHLFIKGEGQAMGLALVSRYPIIKVTLLDSSLFNIKSRPILVAQLATPHGPLHILTCHLPSHSSDPRGMVKKAALQIIDEQIDQLLLADANTMIVLMGDFNINDPSLTFKDFYNPWQTYSKNSTIGSFYFRESWLWLDHFILSPSVISHPNFSLIKFEPFSHPSIRTIDDNNQPQGPHRFHSHQARGYSDHLPLVLTLRR